MIYSKTPSSITLSPTTQDKDAQSPLKTLVLNLGKVADRPIERCHHLTHSLQGWWFSLTHDGIYQSSSMSVLKPLLL